MASQAFISKTCNEFIVSIYNAFLNLIQTGRAFQRRRFTNKIEILLEK